VQVNYQKEANSLKTVLGSFQLELKRLKQAHQPSGAANLSEKSGQLAAGQKQVESALDQLVTGQEALYDGSGKLLTGQQKLTNGLETYNQKFAEAKAGSAKLAAGSGELNSGISKLADGSSAIQDGTNQLADGAGKVDEGVGKLSEGTGELSSKLGEAAEETKDTGTSDKTYDMISDPVKVKDEKVNAVPNYGTGFAPYFLSLGLFVGALLLSIVFPLRQAAGEPKSAIGWFMSKFGILAVIGVIQALLADAVLLKCSIFYPVQYYYESDIYYTCTILSYNIR
jgi:putative membrane protein